MGVNQWFVRGTYDHKHLAREDDGHGDHLLTVNTHILS